MDDTLKILIAKNLHGYYVERLKRMGVSSRLSPWGEDFMKPWSRLSAQAKRYDIDAIEDLEAMLELLGFEFRQEKCK